jgi:multicomponent Na+:H+ antiporter subunit E
MNRLALIVWLTVVWCALWGEASVGNIAAGVALSTIVVVAFPVGEERGAVVRPLAVVRYGVVFVRELLVATVTVAVQVVKPRNALAEAIVAVPLRSRSPVVAAFVANSITLTPGTMTVDVRPSLPEGGDDDTLTTSPSTIVLYVHCLAVTDPDAVRADGLAFEELVVKAFGTAADREAITRPAPRWPLSPEETR